MDIIYSDISVFLTSGLGIVLQILAFTAAVIPGVRWMSQRLDNRIDDQIDDKLNPVVKDICNQLTDVSTAMQIYKSQTDTAIKYLNRAIDGLRGIQTDNEIKRYMKEHQSKEPDE